MIGSGPASSMRGAAYLSGVDQGVVVDAGGRRTDVGLLVNGIPRVSPLPFEIGGVHTAFHMPDVRTLHVGGGSVVHLDQVPPSVGREDVGSEVGARALVFGGATPTLLDAAVAGGRAAVGTTSVRPGQRSRLLQALAAVDVVLVEAVDRVTTALAAPSLVAVGGASVLVPDHLAGVSEVIRPPDGEVASAIGAAIAPVAGHVDVVCPSRPDRRREAVADARSRAIARAILAGADPDRVEIVDVEEVPLSYLDDPPIRLRVTAAGPWC
jgi:N-methylhydantoinase A/oxoprolinase/acetone carboxylase beta subunit